MASPESRVRRRVLQATGAAGLGSIVGTASASAESSGREATEDRILVENGTIVSMDPDVGEFDEGDLLVVDGRIEDIGEDLDCSDAARIDASEMLVVPGFVNGHAHLWQTPIRGIAGELSLTEYFVNVHSAVRPHYTPEDVYLGNLLGSLEQLSAGTTTVLDFSHALHTPAHSTRAIDALLESGIRSVFAHAPPGDEKWWGDSALEHPVEEAHRLADRLAEEPLVDLGLAIRGPDFSTEEVTSHDIRLARELDALSTMHIGTSTYEGPADHGLPALADEGLLGPDVNFVHANELSSDLLELVADHGTSISVTPEVEMQMGHGLPVTGDYLEAGGLPVIGTDIVSGIAGDMFAQMRIALQFERGLRNARALERGEIRESLELTTQDALRMATIDGARALGLEDEVGSLTPGKRADLVLLRTTDVNVVPVHDPIQSIVLQAGPENVDTVLVDGKVVKSGNELVYSKLEQRRRQLVRAGERLLRESGTRVAE